jgi:hypothetical protein
MTSIPALWVTSADIKSKSLGAIELLVRRFPLSDATASQPNTQPWVDSHLESVLLMKLKERNRESTPQRS